MARRLRLGELLVNKNLITREQLDKAVAAQLKSGDKLGQILISLGYITEDDLLKFLAEQLSIPIYDLKNYYLDSEIAKKLSEAYARRYKALILEEDQKGYLIGMVDPEDIHAIDELKAMLKKPLRIAIVRESDLLRTLDIVYRRTDDITSFAEQLDETLARDEIKLADLMAEKGRVDAPVIKLLQSVFEDAVQVHASDIHIEPDEEVLRIRLRIDGVLNEQIVKERGIASAIALRLKLMAGLNMAEKRLPQDGRFNIKVRDRVIDVRMSTMPVQYGESIVMRLLDQSGGMLNFEELGMPDDMLKRVRRLLKSPFGLLLVTGPTGSGKSTTLYGGLNELNDPSKKIITVEDPVEYRLPRINQVQIKEKLGLTFFQVLRSALRQDPDIIMVGEMRDQETAEMALRAALTGHLVLSTLHTNDSASSALRLIDMGLQGFLVGATLKGVLAQRLVRRVCDSCAEAYQTSEVEQSWLQGIESFKELKPQFKKGKGCAYCNHTGYKGRIGVYELLELTPQMIDALRENSASKFADETTKVLKGKLLLDNALKLAAQGVTTVSEVIKVMGEGN